MINFRWIFKGPDLKKIYNLKACLMVNFAVKIIIRFTCYDFMDDKFPTVNINCLKNILIT